MSSIVCPICKKNDMARKIFSIVKEQTKFQAMVGGISGLGIDTDDVEVGGGVHIGSGITSSSLAMALMPPLISIDKKKAIKGLIISLLISYFIFNFISFLIFGFASSISTTLVVGLVFYFFYYCYLKASKDTAKEIIKKYSKNWLNLYYCFRDDIVFDPETGAYCNPEPLLILKMLGATEEEIAKISRHI